MSDTDKISKRLGKLESDMHSFLGHTVAHRQRQEYAGEHWGELYGMCMNLVRDIEFDERNSRKKTANESDSLHGEAFAAGISGRCGNCELDAELQAENDKLREAMKNKDIFKNLPRSYYICEKKLWCGSIGIDIDHVDYDIDKPLDYEKAVKKMEQALKG